MSQTTSPLDQEPLYTQVRERILGGDTNTAIARELPVSRDAVRRFRTRHKLNPAALGNEFTEIVGDRGVVSNKPTTDGILTDPDVMLEQRGLDPAEWVITSLRANEYEGPNSAEAAEETGEAKIKYYQTRFNVQRKASKDLIHAARADGWVAPPKRRDPNPGKSKLVVFVGDQQAPFHDQELHEKFLAWLSDVQPEEGVLIGDTVDLPEPSRHRRNPEHTASVNSCIQGGYDLLRDYVDSSLETRWKKLSGNHDERLRNAVLDQLSELYGVRRAVTPEDPDEIPVLGIEHLLRLDELGIEYIDPQGEYAQGQIKVSKNLAARHGWLAKRGAGSSALATLEHLGFSVVVGHTHRQSLVHKTTHDIDGNPETLAAAEIGCMAQIRGGLGYAVSPDWQAGWATASIWPDGFFKIDLATFVNGTLLWRDERY